jgi:hypothetical protein
MRNWNDDLDEHYRAQAEELDAEAKRLEQRARAPRLANGHRVRLYVQATHIRMQAREMREHAQDEQQ